MAEIGKGDEVLHNLNSRLGRYIAEAQKLEKENRELKERLDIATFAESTDAKPLLLEKARQLEEESKTLEREKGLKIDQNRKILAELDPLKATLEARNRDLQAAEREMVSLEKQHPILKEEIAFLVEVNVKERSMIEAHIRELEAQETQQQENSRALLEKLLQDERKEFDLLTQKEQEELSKYYNELLRKLRERIAYLQRESDALKVKTLAEEKDKLVPAKENWVRLKETHDALINEIQHLKDDTTIAKLNNTGKSKAEELNKLQFESAKANAELNRILTENDRLTIEIAHYRALLQMANKEQPKNLPPPLEIPKPSPVKRVKMFISPTKPPQIKFEETQSGAIRIKEIQQHSKHIELENMTDREIDLRDWCLRLCTSKGEAYSEVFPEGAVLEGESTVIAEIKDDRSSWWFTELEVESFVLLLNNLGEIVARVDVVLDK